MYFYFSSDYPVALKLGGAFFSVINAEIKHCDIDLKTTTLVEVCPLISGQQSKCFLLDEHFNGRVHGGLVTDLKGGYLIKFTRAYTGGEFTVFAQEKFPDALVTVFNDSGLKISVETPSDFFAESVPFSPYGAKIERFLSNGQPLILVTLSGEDELFFVYSIDGKVQKVFSRRGKTCSVDNGLILTEELVDMAKHKVETKWEFENGLMHEKARTVTLSKNFSVDALPDKLLPYAFLEELLVGGDFTAYLDQSIKQNADKLGGYLGEFIGVMPPPLFRNYTEVGLIYAVDESTFKVDYCEFTITNKKICNIKRLPD